MSATHTKNRYFTCEQLSNLGKSGFKNDEHPTTGEEGPTLLVQHLPRQTNLSDLYIYFGQYGEVKLCTFLELDPRKSSSCKIEVSNGYETSTIDLCSVTVVQQCYTGKTAVVQILEYEAGASVLSSQNWMHGEPIVCSLVVKTNYDLLARMEEVNSRKVFIFGLKKSVGEEYLRKFFSWFGGIENVRIVRHRKDNRSKGFGFVIFKTRASRDRTLSSVQFWMDGKPIKCVPFHLFNSQTKQAPANPPQAKAGQGLSRDMSTLPSSTGPWSLNTIKAMEPSEVQQNYRFNRSRIISSAAVHSYYRRNPASRVANNLRRQR